MNKNKRVTLSRLIVIIFVLIALGLVLPAVAFAGDEVKTVRVGYYENEVFQEGAGDGSVKTGYAYEYYRKLSEYTGWRYDGGCSQAVS